ncbi:lipase/esterase [Rhodopirellula maiorica SM1]|uniref:Lipase/esterase n=1 Tax=Rhodopirellula maiorica SM1 TaxID=1265738 RepID=M5RK90_9BACT|nr:alpha/beta hydrolase [Rhodopirellula maiorica]EMI19738.1 lipase/esterase [Rhodopirellula maiorica SM1]
MMNGKTITLTLGILAALLMNGKLSGQDASKLIVHRDLVFAEADGKPLKLDLYLPAVQGKAPLVVWIHGGGWRAGSKAKPPIRKLTEHGYALASISYRFTDTAVFPAQIHDCKAAVRWLRGEAEQFGYNADWITVAGSSAGGYLALMLGVTDEVTEFEGTLGNHREQSSSVQAVVDYFGPSDFVLRGKTQPERAYTEKSGSFALLGGIRDGQITPDIERRASPATYVTADDPPLLVFHGTDDEVVRLDQSEHIVELYTKLGLTAKLVVVESAGHGGVRFFRDPNFTTMLKFLNQHRP